VSPLIRHPKNSCLIPVAAVPILPVPLPVYMVCTLVGRLSMEIAFNIMVLAYGTELFLPFKLHRSCRRHPLRSPRRSSSLLGYRLPRGAVQSNQGPDTQSIEDYGSRRDVLFPGHIHFASRAPDVSYFRKREYTVIIPSLRLAHTFIGTNEATPCPVSETRICVPFVRSPELLPHNSGNFVYVRTLLLSKTPSLNYALGSSQ